MHGLDRFRGNGPYGKIPTKVKPIRTLGVTLPYNNADNNKKISFHADQQWTLAEDKKAKED